MPTKDTCLVPRFIVADAIVIGSNFLPPFDWTLAVEIKKEWRDIGIPLHIAYDGGQRSVGVGVVVRGMAADNATGTCLLFLYPNFVACFEAHKGRNKSVRKIGKYMSARKTQIKDHEK